MYKDYNYSSCDEWLTYFLKRNIDLDMQWKTNICIKKKLKIKSYKRDHL